MEKVNDYESWWGVDLDGTLAKSTGEFDKSVIGEPVEAVVYLVRDALRRGKKVKVFTARAAEPDNIPVIRRWLDELGFSEVEITNEKDPGMEVLIDDKAVQVHPNTGRLVAGMLMSGNW